MDFYENQLIKEGAKKNSIKIPQGHKDGRTLGFYCEM